jgi:hypothetical protein
MLEPFKNISRKRGQALLASLVALIAAITGCDKKVDWRGVSTDSRDAGRSTSPVAAPGEPADGNTP